MIMEDRDQWQMQGIDTDLCSKEAVKRQVTAGEWANGSDLNARPTGTHRSRVLLHLHRRPQPCRTSPAAGLRLADMALDRLNPTYCKLYHERGKH